MSKFKKSISKALFGAEEHAAASIDRKELSNYSDIAVRMFHTRVLTVKELSFPALAEFASRLLSGITYYRTLYFVNVLKIDMIYVTAILTLIGIYDVLNNPIMGMAYDRTRTRWGKARPYIMFATLPYFLSTAILFSGASFLGNSAGDDPKKIIFVFIMLFAQETFSTIYAIPRNNMVSLMSPNPKDRITVGLLNTYIGEAGAQLVYIIFLPLMELNNKGYINAPMSSVFAIVTFITASIGAFSNIAMAIGCRERIILQPDPAPITKSIFYILKNKYARRNFIANFAVSWWSSGGYSWDVVTQMEIFGGSFYSFLAYLPYNILDPLSIGLIPKFQKLFKNNNRNAVIWLRLWDLFSAVGMCVLGWFFVDRKWIIIAIYAVFYGLNALNNGPANVFEAELGREISDYTEYMTGERPDGTINILTDLITKVTSPINALLTIFLFKWSGYDTSIPMLPWSQGNKFVYQKVFFLFTGIGLLPHVIRMIPYLFYDLVGEKREKMYLQLNERRALIAEQDDGKNKDVEKMIEMLEEESQ
ncbi:MAG: MFS transporter [Acutalibacteraceae bacterium]|jgi:Na+/melibiose symporter-like transporter